MGYFGHVAFGIKMRRRGQLVAVSLFGDPRDIFSRMQLALVVAIVTKNLAEAPRFATQEEVEKGTSLGPFSAAAIEKGVGPLRVRAKRFPAEQNRKVNDFSANMVNFS